MGARGFKYFTIQSGGTPQPLIGSYLTAALTAAAASAGTLQGGLIQNKITLTVADSSMFTGAEYATITDPGTFFTERVRVLSTPSSTTMTVQALDGVALSTHPGGAYGTGAWVALGDLVQSINVQILDTVVNAMWVGDSPRLVKATGVHALYKLTPNLATSFSTQSSVNTATVSQFWIDGTTADSYLPYLGVV